MKVERRRKATPMPTSFENVQDRRQWPHIVAQAAKECMARASTVSDYFALVYRVVNASDPGLSSSDAAYVRTQIL